MNIEEDMSSEDYLAGETISKVAESLRDRKSRMERNRAIRKCKMHFNEDVKEIDLKDMTMEQKLERQKMKNREAAQKSRYNKKNYLYNLQNENRYLKMKLEIVRYCYRCKTLIYSYTDDPSSQQLPELERIEVIPDSLDRQKYQDYFMDPFIVDDDEASTFTRSQNFEEPSSIGIFLFVCMVMVCVFTFAGMSPGTDGSRRDLLQLYEVSDSLINEPILKTIVEDTVSFEEEKLNYHLANNPKDFSRTKEILIEKVRSEYPYPKEPMTLLLESTKKHNELVPLNSYSVSHQFPEECLNYYKPYSLKNRPVNQLQVRYSSSLPNNHPILFCHDTYVSAHPIDLPATIEATSSAPVKNMIEFLVTGLTAKKINLLNATPAVVRSSSSIPSLFRIVANVQSITEIDCTE